MLAMLIANALCLQISDAEVPHEDIDKEVAHAEKHKFDEVNNLMSKYDKAEARVKYLNSPEYALKQEQEAKEAEQRKKQEEMDKKMAEVTKKLKEKEESENRVNEELVQASHKEVEEQQNQEYLEQTVK